MGFLSGILTGSNPTLPGAINTATGVAGYGTGTGEGYTNTAGNFLQTLIGGDPNAISKLLAPQINAQAQQANQKIQTGGEFANRSGGVNAGNETTLDTTRGNIGNEIASLTGGAVGQLGQMGQNLINTGLDANKQAEQFGQQEMENSNNSVLGGLIGGAANVAGSYLSGGLSNIFKKIPGFGSPTAGGNS